MDYTREGVVGLVGSLGGGGESSVPLCEVKG